MSEITRQSFYSGKRDGLVILNDDQSAVLFVATRATDVSLTGHPAQANVAIAIKDKEVNASLIDLVNNYMPAQTPTTTKESYINGDVTTNTENEDTSKRLTVIYCDPANHNDLHRVYYGSMYLNDGAGDVEVALNSSGTANINLINAKSTADKAILATSWDNITVLADETLVTVAAGAFGVITLVTKAA